MTRVATEPEQAHENRLKTRIARDRALDDLRFLLDQPQFRRFVWRVFEFCGRTELVADNSGSWTYFNDGKRSVSKEIEDVIRAARPKAIGQMELENAEGEMNV